MKKVLLLSVFILLLGLGAYLFLHYQWGPHGPGGVVYIPKGSSVTQISQELEKAGLIPNTWSFKLLARWKGIGRELKPGEYQFPPQVTAAQILEKLRKGDRLFRTLVIPEGYNLQQIAEAIAQTGMATKADALAAMADPRYLNLLGFPAPSLEGYLFPSTYQYDSRTTLSDLLSQMIKTFQENFDEDLQRRAQKGGWTIPQVVTLASIIEKETSEPSERPLIASVFQNRLKIGMPLQSDPTIIYGLKDYDGDIRKKDIRNPHPYNTYVHVGLPPGPIASPGKGSLRAVLYPADTNYLFFVAKKDGTHQFSKNLAEHNQAVQRYQLSPPAPSPSPETKPTPASQPSPKWEGSANRPLMKPVPLKNK